MGWNWPELGETQHMELRPFAMRRTSRGSVHLNIIASIFTLWCCLPGAYGVVNGTAIWNEVLQRSCPFEFQPKGSSSGTFLNLTRENFMYEDWEAKFFPSGGPTTRMKHVASWIGDKYDPKIMQEALFDYESISSWPTNPWTTNVACGAMLAYNPSSIVFTSYSMNTLGWPEPLGPEGPADSASQGLLRVECETYLTPVRHPVLALVLQHCVQNHAFIVFWTTSLHYTACELEFTIATRMLYQTLPPSCLLVDLFGPIP
jgi:hypothetical protein